MTRMVVNGYGRKVAATDYFGLVAFVTGLASVIKFQGFFIRVNDHMAAGTVLLLSGRRFLTLRVCNFFQAHHGRDFQGPEP